MNYDWLMDGEGEMFSDLPQTVLDELCSQYELDDLDRFIVELYVGLPKDVRDGIKARAKDLFRKGILQKRKNKKGTHLDSLLFVSATDICICT